MQINIIIKHLKKTNARGGRFCIATAINSQFALYLLRASSKSGYNYAPLNINTKLKISNLIQFDCDAERNCYNRFSLEYCSKTIVISKSFKYSTA